MVDRMKIYDSVIHNPTNEEKNILSRILFQEKFEYRYKVDDKYVYYIKEDLEKNRPLVAEDSNKRKEFGKIKRISEELPIGIFSNQRGKVKKGTNAEMLPQQWADAFQTIQPNYMYPDHEIKIVDQNMYNSMKGRESTVFIGKTDDFKSFLKE